MAKGDTHIVAGAVWMLVISVLALPAAGWRGR